jgi:hypothetical protein
VSKPGKRVAHVGGKGVHPSWRPRWLAWARWAQREFPLAQFDFGSPVVALTDESDWPHGFLAFAWQVFSVRSHPSAEHWGEREAARESLRLVRLAWLAHVAQAEALADRLMAEARYMALASDEAFAVARKALQTRQKIASSARVAAARVARREGKEKMYAEIRASSLPAAQLAERFGITPTRVRQIRAKQAQDPVTRKLSLLQQRKPLSRTKAR